MKSRRWVLYPILFALYPVLSLYAENARWTPLLEVALPAAMVTIAAAVVWLVLRLIVRDTAKSALLAVLAMIVFDTIALAPGWVDELLSAISVVWVLQNVHVWPPVVVAAELAIAAGLAYGIARLKTPGSWTKVLNAFAAILIALPIVSIVRIRAGQRYEAIAERKAAGAPPPAVTTAHVIGRRPDIYYIILDGYARTDVMSELFGLDIEPFLKRLEAKGFYVARRSTANYCQTPLSLSSSLNATYLNGRIPASWSSTAPLNKWTGDGSVAVTLKGLGYRFVTFATGFTETEHPEAEFYLSPFPYTSAFHRLLLDRTPLSRLAPIPVMADSYTITRKNTLHLFEKLPEIARWGAPTFTFAHILSPHPPFIFDKDGRDVSPRERPYLLTDGNVFREWYGDRDVYINGYREQAAFLTDRVELAIDQILANSPEPPVIILQSDHGSGLGLSTEAMEKTDLHERMSITNAYYLPGKGSEGLYQDISPVNSFRVVLNAYFGAGLELLPDRSYYSTWADPLGFLDVTDKVRLPRESQPKTTNEAINCSSPSE